MPKLRDALELKFGEDLEVLSEVLELEDGVLPFPVDLFCVVCMTDPFLE